MQLAQTQEDDKAMDKQGGAVKALRVTNYQNQF
jgi:hypothetical protein